MTRSFGLGFLLLFLPWALAQEPIAFQWNPPDGARWIEHTTLTKQRLKGRDVVRTEITDTTGQVHVRRTAGGWIVSTTPSAHTFTLNGRRVEPLMLEPLRRAALDLVVNPSCEAVAVVGFRKVEQELAAQAARSGPPARFDARPLEGLERARWKIRYGSLAGQTVELGEIWEAKGSFRPSPEVAVPFLVRTRFVEWAERLGHRCVRIEIQYQPDPAEKARGQVTGSGERLVDPDTLLVYWERDERVASFPARVLSIDPTTLIERRQYEITPMDASAVR